MHTNGKRFFSGDGGESKNPISVDPQLFFANEKTFLAWLHISTLLIGASIAILSLADDTNPFSEVYGILILPVAIVFLSYAILQYMRRASMIRQRIPGSYEDIFGYTVLAVMLMLSIAAQISVALYSLIG